MSEWLVVMEVRVVIWCDVMINRDCGWDRRREMRDKGAGGRR